MLKELLSPTYDFIAVDDHVVVVRGKRNVNPGKTISLRAGYPDGRRSPVFKMLVDSCRPLTNGGFALSGRVTSGTAVPEGDSIVVDEALRSGTRIDCHMCVLSKELPGFRCVAIDFSRGGVQLEISDAVDVGQSVLLRLEFDVDSIAPVECRARVAWCTEKERNRYRVGLQFVNLDPLAKSSVEKYESILAGRDETSILHRILFGNDYGRQEGVATSAAPQEPSRITQIQPLTGSRHEGRLVGYIRSGSDLVVRLERADGSMGEYQFKGLRGLSDHAAGDPNQILVGDVVVKGAAGGSKRFQFIDTYRSLLLEVVASSCTFR